MLNNKDTLLLKLKKLGLTPDECKIYVSLLDSSKSHLELARRTGVNRTKIYRIAEELTKRGLITLEHDDLGKRLAANSPDNLEISLTTAEEKLRNQRQILDQILPDLQGLFTQAGTAKPSDFIVNTYEGVDGFKQMLWNELKTKGELLAFGDGTLQVLVDDIRWAEKHRAKQVEAGYAVREILNPNGKPSDFTNNQDFIDKVFSKKIIDPSIIPLSQQVITYNHTVSIYNWREGKKVGVEIVNPAYAAMQRSIFEHYWKMAK